MITRRKLLAWSAPVAALPLAACTAVPTDPQQCKALSNGKLLPRSGVDIQPLDSASTLPKVAIIDAGNAAGSLAIRAELGKSVSASIKQAIDSRGVELVDTGNLPGQLQSMLRTAEALGTSTYQGPQLADFAFVPEIGLAEYEAPFTDAVRIPIKGEMITLIPAQFKHRASVRLTIRIVKMPSMQLVQTIRTSGEAKRTDQVQGMSDEVGKSLLRLAAADAVSKARDDLLQSFKRKGQIVARRECEMSGLLGAEKFPMFLASIGAGQGVATGDTVEIYYEEEFSAPGVSPRMEKKPVAVGTVSKQVTENDAWIWVTSERAARVRAGDTVAVTFKKGGR